MFVSLGNMLLYIIYQSLNCEWLCFDSENLGIVYCVWQTILNILFGKFILCHECMYFAVCWCEKSMYIYGL